MAFHETQHMDKLDPLDTAVFRWAWHRVRHDHLHGVLVACVGLPVITAAFAAVVRPESTASLLTRVEAGVIAALAAFLIVTTLIFAGAVVVAPYEQRNALRQPLREKNAAPAVEARAVGWLKLSITNHGAAGTFKVKFAHSPHFLAWRHRPAKDGGAVFERRLLSGEQAVIQAYSSHDDLNELTWLILADVLEKPLAVKCSLRVTQLDVHEMKLAHEDWPERNAGWLASAEQLLAKLKPVGARFAAIAADDKAAASEIVGAYQGACHEHPEVVGHEFMYSRLNNQVSPSLRGKIAASDEVSAYRACIERAVSDLEESLARGTDVV
jgi:hypothetical protein